jgi:hypothetical protein
MKAVRKGTANSFAKLKLWLRGSTMNNSKLTKCLSVVNGEEEESSQHSDTTDDLSTSSCASDFVAGGKETTATLSRVGTDHDYFYCDSLKNQFLTQPFIFLLHFSLSYFLAAVCRNYALSVHNGEPEQLHSSLRVGRAIVLSLLLQACSH